QEAERPFLQRATRVYRVIMRRQGQYLRLGVPRANPAQRLEAAHARHGEIHHHHVGAELEIKLACGLAAVSLGDDRHFRRGLQQQAKSHAHHGVIVNQEDSNHVWLSKGMSAARQTPRPCRLPMVNVPPNCRTRSAKPRKPKCPGRAQSAGNPTPSSVTVAVIRRTSHRTAMSTFEACACRRALIRPSCTTR